MRIAAKVSDVKPSATVGAVRLSTSKADLISKRHDASRATENQ
jgi:hypothetical protein